MSTSASKTIVDLRAMRTAFIRRKSVIHEAVSAIRAVTATISERDFSAYVTEFADFGDEEDESYVARLQEEVGFKDGSAVVPVISEAFLFPLICTGYSAGVTARNTVAEIKAIFDLSRPGIEPDEADGEPVLTGWTNREIEIVIRALQRDIDSTNTKLRDIHTNWKYLSGQRSLMPARFKSRLLGFFGSGDHTLPFEYGESDFTFDHSTYYRDQGLPILSAKWLAPSVGADNALLIEKSLALIEETARPRDGEPDTLNHFGSHATNRMSLFQNATLVLEDA